MENEAFDWQPFALLLIDVQQDFWTDDLPRQYPRFPENMDRLLQFCRMAGIEVVHIRSIFQPDGSDWMARYRLGKRIPCIAGTPGVEVLPFARELPGEKVMVKHTFDGFLMPELLPYLQQKRKRFLFTAGLITSTCVLFTTTSAMQRGFLTAIIEDCCADEPARHEFTLDSYPFIFDRVKVAFLPEQYARWAAALEVIAG